MSSRKSTKKCGKRSHGVKAHMRNGKKIKSHCSKNKSRSRKASRKASRKGSRKGSRKASRKGSKKAVKRVVCPPGTVKVKSHKHGSKRVKSYCRKDAVKRIQNIRTEVAELREEEQAIREALEKPNCDELVGKNQCVDALDKENLRRCRYNMNSGSCEYLPVDLRQRATLQVGGSAEYKPYVAGARQKLQRGAPQSGYKAPEGRQVGKISDEQKGFLAGLFGGK